METAQEKAQALLVKLVEAEKIDAQLKELRKAIYVETQDLYDAMTEQGLDSLEIQGIKFKPDVDQDFSINDMEGRKGLKWDDYEMFFPWLKEIGYGDIIKIKESVHPATRKKILSEIMEKAHETGVALPVWIKETFHNTIKYNKSAIKRLASE